MEYRAFPEKVSIFEVGPRDGLQNEPEFIQTENKIRLVDGLSEAGCRDIEVTSFVHPKRVPQMRDAREVFAGIAKKAGVAYSALIPNQMGLELAIEAGFERVVTIMSSSESHNQRNLNMSVEQSLREIEAINKRAAGYGVKVRSYIATSFGCPIEGEVLPDRVAEIAAALEAIGSSEISLGDTTGMANPCTAYTVPSMVRSKLNTASLAVHYHQCMGIEYANVLASLEAGITVFDSAVGGLGGCPFAPGATGNIATEVLAEMFERMGISTGIDLQNIRDCGDFAKGLSAIRCSA